MIVAIFVNVAYVHHSTVFWSLGVFESIRTRTPGWSLPRVDLTDAVALKGNSHQCSDLPIRLGADVKSFQGCRMFAERKLMT
jgi:hypothetical protein